MRNVKTNRIHIKSAGFIESVEPINDRLTIVSLNSFKPYVGIEHFIIYAEITNNPGRGLGTVEEISKNGKIFQSFYVDNGPHYLSIIDKKSADEIRETNWTAIEKACGMISFR